MARKILIISALDVWSLGVNTGAQSLAQTLQGYAKEGWQVHFLVCRNNKERTNLELDNVTIKKFGFSPFESFKNPKFFGLAFRSLWWIYFQIAAVVKGYQITKREKIDLFYGYEVHAVPAAKLLSILFKKPVVSRFQGTLLSQYFVQPKPFWKLRNWWHVLALKIKTNLVIMANDGTKGDEVLRDFGVDMKKVRFWTNGVDKEAFEATPAHEGLKARFGLSENDKVLLSVSRLEKWKGVDRTISALPLILTKFPETKFLVFGDGSERKNLENLTQILGVQKSVKFLGAVEHSDLPRYYQAADIFVSMYDLSNVGNPLFEAMLSGKAIVTFDTGDTAKFVRNGETGMLVSDTSPQTVSEAIVRLLDNNELRQVLGKKARHFAERNFWTWEFRMEKETREVGSLIEKS